MKKTKWTSAKRLLSAMLVLVMVLGMLPVSSLAAGPEKLTNKVTMEDNGVLQVIVTASAEKQAVKAGETVNGFITIRHVFMNGASIKWETAFEASSGAEPTILKNAKWSTKHTTTSPSGSSVHDYDPIPAKFTVDETGKAKITLSGKCIIEQGSTTIKYTYGEAASGYDSTSNVITLEGFTVLQPVTYVDDFEALPKPLREKPDYTDGSPSYTIPLKYAPKYEGYRFMGWRDDAGWDRLWQPGEKIPSGINGPLTLTAEWRSEAEIDADATLRPISITYDANLPTTAPSGAKVENVPPTAKVRKGDTYTVPQIIPQLQGYEFGGWTVYEVGNSENPVVQPGYSYQVKENATLRAVWIDPTHAVEFISQGEPGATYAYIETPASGRVRVGDSMYFTAEIPEDCDPASFQATLQNGTRQLAPQRIVENAFGVTTLYFDFIVTQDMLEEGTGNLVITHGPLQEKQYTVTLPVGDHFTAAFAETDENTDEKVDVVSYEGPSREFTITPEAGWEINEVVASGDCRLEQVTDENNKPTGAYQVAVVMSNVSVSVSMKQIPNYTIHYSIDGQYFLQQSIAGKKPLGQNDLLWAPKKTGYRFEGWYTNWTCTKKIEYPLIVTGDVYLYGKYTPVTGTISYKLNAPADAETVSPAAIAATAKTYGLSATLSDATPASNNYSFLGWAKSENSTTVVYRPGDTISEELPDGLTLYGVWEKKVYAVTVHEGAGTSINTSGPLTVAHGDDFSFRVVVDEAHSEQKPVVWLNRGVDVGGMKLSSRGNAQEPEGENYKVYSYVVKNVTGPITLNIMASTNEVYDVSFVYAGLTGRTESPKSGETYLTQKVSWNETAAQPAAPQAEGFRFAGWYDTAEPVLEGTELTPAYDFKQAITKDTKIYAVFTPYRPTVTADPMSGEGWELTNWKVNGEKITLTGTSFSVPYGADVTFELIVADGFDYSLLSVACNGMALVRAGEAVAEKKDDQLTGRTILPFRLSAVKADTRITVTGLARRMITIIYNDNGGFGGPVLDKLPAYAADRPSDNYSISSVVPTRAGYEFKAWSTDNRAEYVDGTFKHAPNVTYVDLAPGQGHKFTQDTVLYAVWAPKQTGLTLEVSGAMTTETTTGEGDEAVVTIERSQYEKENVTLTATVASENAAVTSGSVQFYRNGVLIGTAKVSGGKAVWTQATSDYHYNSGNEDNYDAVFIPDEGSGYTQMRSDHVIVKVRSAAISWRLDGGRIAADANKLTIKNQDGSPASAMTAGKIYTLELPGIYALDDSGTKLVCGKDYTVTWQYRNAAGTWTDYPDSASTDSITVTAAFSQYVFRAVVKPLTGATGHFTKAAAYEASALLGDQYTEALITGQTDAVGRQASAVTLRFENVFTNKEAAPMYSQYENREITIVAAVTGEDGTSVRTGNVDFYVVTKADGAHARIGTRPVNASGEASITYTLPAYDAEDSLANIEYFFAVYTDTDGVYETSNSANLIEINNDTVAGALNQEKGNHISKKDDAVQILSETISWKLKGNQIAANANRITVWTAHENGSMKDKLASGAMTAGSSYVLQLPGVYALDEAGQTGPAKLEVKKDYTVVWQYREFGASQWQDYVNSNGRNSILVTPEFSGYQFQAVVTPIYDNDALTGFRTAAKYGDKADNNGRVIGRTQSLVTLPTNKTELQATVTDLVITGENLLEKAGTMINGQARFANDHLAQYEGQNVTLRATVVDEKTGEGVNTGVVYFYRYVDGVNDELLNAVPIDVRDGAAELETTAAAYTADQPYNAAVNIDRFYVVYQANASYNTSASVGKTDTAYSRPATVTPADKADSIFIKSAKLRTPIIESDKQGLVSGAAANATTYTGDLTNLPTGERITFTLRQDGAAAARTADWSVVALDGRDVDSSLYTISWLVKTGNNETVAGGDSAQNAYVLTESKVDDQYRVKLTGSGVFQGSEAYSKYAIIGVKKDTTIVVTATDEIAATADLTDVYQCSDITLTATVRAPEGASMQPGGSVTFYYSVDGGTTWVKLADKASRNSVIELKKVEGEMRASIITDQLPVTEGTNTRQVVRISVTYSGDETFNAVEDQADAKITPKDVTVYSSVVYVRAEDQNKLNADAKNHDGISIDTIGTLAANEEKVTLVLSEIYTLDHTHALSKLAYGTDYTVQWQVLENAGSATTDFAEKTGWSDLPNATGTQYTLSTVTQGAAYRAVIYVKDTPAAKGSFTEVDQGTVGQKDINDGCKVYYSNVLLVSEGDAAVSVILNTSNREDNYEGIVQGETVTINVLVSGAVNTAPISSVTATITDAMSGEEVASFTENNVHGWNDFQWDTSEVSPGFYKLTVDAVSSNGYADRKVEQTLIVREGSYGLRISGSKTVYNGQTQGLSVTLENFEFNDSTVVKAAEKSWTVKYYQNGVQVEPIQAGEYTATVTLPGSTWWNALTIENIPFTIEKRTVRIADVIAQAKVYDGSASANIVEVMLNDAVTAQASTGLPVDRLGLINGDSVYVTAQATLANGGNAGETTLNVTVSDENLHGDDAHNYTFGANTTYSESIYVSRSQVYGNITGNVTIAAGEAFPADAIYLIDQSGKRMQPGEYTLTYYYHSDSSVEKTADTSREGLYTVIARPDQSNYKGGVATTFRAAGQAQAYTPAPAPTASTLISFSNTAELYGRTTGLVITATEGASITEVTYNGVKRDASPAAAGRYLVKATASTGDVAYGIYTVTKANPALTLAAPGTVYTSMPYAGQIDKTEPDEVENASGDYLTWTGDVAIGYNVPAEGNVQQQKPVDAGSYVLTLHTPETANYTAHEISVPVTIGKKALSVTADSWNRWLNGAFPEMTASYDGLAGTLDADSSPDTSLRDVQVAPELVFNYDAGGFTNDLQSEFGEAKVQATNGLMRNYTVTYLDGVYKTTVSDPQEQLAIHGLPQNADQQQNLVYFGDVIQLYAYGDRDKAAGIVNTSSFIKWEITAGTDVAKIDAKLGLLTVTGVGEFTIQLTRGTGANPISVRVNVTALKKELKVSLDDQDVVYNASEQSYDTALAHVFAYDELYRTAALEKALVTDKLTRTDIGAQLPTAQISKEEAHYQSEVYGGTFTVNDKEATIEPDEDVHIYGELRRVTTATIEGQAGTVLPVTDVATGSQTDVYNRLDVYDGYEILVGGTDNMNYNVRYITDQDAKDSEVTTYEGVRLYSTTVKAAAESPFELNDATVYGEKGNLLTWILTDAIADARTHDADNLADFNLEPVFIRQDFDFCTGNADCGHTDEYKAANRTLGNKAVLQAPRTSVNPDAHANYVLQFTSVRNTFGENYLLKNEEEKNAQSSMTPPVGTLGFVGAAATGDNLIEGSANISQRPVTLQNNGLSAETAYYWHIDLQTLYDAFLEKLTAEGLADKHTIRDLDLCFTLTQGSSSVTMKPDASGRLTGALDGLDVGKCTVTVTVGDTNYKLTNDPFTFEVTLKAIQIEATYTTKEFTRFTVLIKEHLDDGTTRALTSADGLTYKIFKSRNGVVDESVVYAQGSLSYTGRTSRDDAGDLCGVFTASYTRLPRLESGELYFIQMYENGVKLVTNND